MILLIVALNAAIAAAYLTMAGFLAPRLGLPRAGRVAAIAFFGACGLTHVELAIHGMHHAPEWFTSPHMLVIHGVQAVVDWAFIVVATRYLDIEFAPKASRSSRRLASALELARAGGWEVDLRTGTWSWTDGLVELSDGALEEASAKRIGLEAVVHPADASKLEDALARAKAGRETAGSFEHRLRGGEGRVGVTRWRVTEVEDGVPVSVAGVVQDVTETRRAEESARRAERETARFFELSRDLLCIANAEGRFVRVNGAWQETLGWTAEDLTARPFVEFVHPDDVERTVAETRRLITGGEAVDFENRYRTADGGYRILQWSAKGIVEDGLILARATDVTDERRRDALRDLQSAVTAVLASGGDADAVLEDVLRETAVRIDRTLAAVWLRDADGTTLRCIRAWAASPDVQARFWSSTIELELPHGLGTLGQAFARRTGEFVSDLSADARFVRRELIVDELGFRSGIFIPLVGGERVTGVLEFFSADEKPVENDLLLTLHDIGSQVGQFVERWLAEEATRVAKSELEVANAELARSNAQLQRQNDRLQELDRLKDTLIATVSHELRTPLTSIGGYAELLLERQAGDLTEEQERFVGVIDRNSRRLVRVVGDLLFLARVDAGQLELDGTTVDLREVVRECFDSARPNAEAKGITLRLEDEALAPLWGDRGRLAQLIDNLLSNAIKFTPEGGRVDVRVAATDGRAVAEVRDTGIGIPAEEREKIFERFFRTEAAGKHAIQGTGLGLAITKAIAEAHGGTVAVTSEDGLGTTFRVELPLERDPGLSSAAGTQLSAA